MTGINFLSLFFIALGDSADCFAVALSGSWRRKKNLTRPPGVTGSASLEYFRRYAFAGLACGRTFVNIIGGYDHWVAFAITDSRRR